MQPGPAEPAVDPCSARPSRQARRSPAPGPHRAAMPPSSTPRGGRKPTASFGSVAWLSQSSHVGRLQHPSPDGGSSGSLSAPARVSRSGEVPQATSVEEPTSPEVSVSSTSTTGPSQEAGSSRPPRARTAFTAEQVGTLESAFQQQRYLGPPERRRLAREMGLSELQIKTWFQNRRMKQKRQLQDWPWNVPLPGALCPPLALCPPHSALGSRLQLLGPWASLPGPSVLTQPPGSFWGPCQVEPASLASAWAAGGGGQPPVCCPPDPGSQGHAPDPAWSGRPWGLCVLPEAGDAF